MPFGAKVLFMVRRWWVTTAFAVARYASCSAADSKALRRLPVRSE